MGNDDLNAPSLHAWRTISRDDPPENVGRRLDFFATSGPRGAQGLELRAVDAARGVSLDFELGAEFDDLSCRHAEKGG